MGYWLYYKVMRLNKEQPQVSNFYIPVLMYTGLNGSKFNNCSLKNFAIDKNNFDIKRTLYEFIENYEGIKNKISQENNSNVKHIASILKKISDIII
ncbi:hypothetical protein PVMG_02274 [Plasmodium vivax Mauritania I]|uniref:Uncharacterized protein n=1 Tax=Plasmodium vivax Mauritania I TaxID=1035515 RepID=A0A0J9W1Q3_PLAVI|nr:hypothetical protein PVMG_02274 [Plasmodium vivax Mauritania I]